MFKLILQLIALLQVIQLIIQFHFKNSVQQGTNNLFYTNKFYNL